MANALLADFMLKKFRKGDNNIARKGVSYFLKYRANFIAWMTYERRVEKGGIEMTQSARLSKTPVKTSKHKSVTKMSLQDVYTSWLELEHPKKAGGTNRDRTKSDLLNFRRALQCVAAGSGHGWEELHQVPLKTLEINEALLTDRVAIGCQILAKRKGRVASKKTIANTVSCVKAIRNTVFESYDRPAEGPGPIQIYKDMPKRRYRPKFASKAWPERLKQEWAGYREWKLKPILDPSEDEYRSEVCRPITIDRGHSLRVNSYVGYLVREKSMSDFGLLDLCDTRNFSDFVAWHCAQDYRGGYLLLGTTATVLATISQYLVAKRLLPLVIDGKKPWDTFYDLKRRILKLGASRGEISGPTDVGSWKPDDLRRIGIQAWETDPVRRKGTKDVLYGHSIFARRRVGVLFFLAPETPFRARNWMEMKWHKNLSRNPDGRWRVRFIGEELKVSHRGYVPNVYEHTYSPEASQMIDRYRAFVATTLGSDFEQRSPYVFMPCNPGRGRCGEQLTLHGFSRGMNLLVLELRDETFHPHKIRHIVGSYLVNEYGAKGLGIAARLLGDTPDMVMKSYYRPSAERDLEGYFATLRG